MQTCKELLQSLNLGKSVAEFDNDLEEYFVENEAFRSLVNDACDIIAGDKGTGKTAIYRILEKRYGKIEKLQKTEVLPAFNPSGSPIFEKLGEHPSMDEGQYIRFWKLYFLSLAGNWLLKIYDGHFTDTMAALHDLLSGLDIRDKYDAPGNIFQRALHKLGAFFKWRSVAIDFELTAEGSLKFSPKLESDAGSEKDHEREDVPIRAAFNVLSASLKEADVTLWIAMDRLDEAFQGFSEIEIPALRALLRTYLDLLEFENIRLKLFLRRDLFRRVVEGGFVNLTHVNARKFEVIWDEEDLLNLLCKRVRKSQDFYRAIGSPATNQEVFDAIFPDQVDPGTRKPRTWVWIIRRIRDGNDIKPPRNLIDLIAMAQAAQLRIEDREKRNYDDMGPIILPEAMKRALTQLSVTRVNDTLLAEAKGVAPLLEKFRGGKAEHNDQSLAELLGMAPADVKGAIRPLVSIGFLEEIGGTYKVPTLYREGLDITQGKAFAGGSDIELED